MSDKFLLACRDDIKMFVEGRAGEHTGGRPFRTHDIVGIVVASHLLECHEQAHHWGEILIRYGNDGGGWSFDCKPNEPCLVSTFFAVTALQKIGQTVPPQHLSWLLSLQHSSNLCVFSRSDFDESLEASALVLNALSNSDCKNLTKVTELGHAVADRLPEYIRTYNPHHAQLIRDKNSGFTIFAYGRAMSGLNNLGHDLWDCGLDNLVSLCKGLEDLHDDKSSAICIFDPMASWVPEVLEVAIASHATKHNFDPFRYASKSVKAAEFTVKDDLRRAKLSLDNEAHTVRLRHAVVDEMQRDVIRQRGEVNRLLAGASEVILKSAHEETTIDLKRANQDLVRTIQFWTAVSAFFLTGAVPLVILIGESKFNFGRISSVTTLAIIIISLGIMVVKWLKNRELGKEIANRH